MMTQSVAVLIGSLCKESFNRRLPRALAALPPASLHLEIGQPPLYSQDEHEGDPPTARVAFRERVKPFNAMLFVTPEYNRSVPEVWNNALDVGARPYGQSVWDGKPGTVVSVSLGAIGGCGANHHLRQSLVFLSVPTLQRPEAYIGGAAGLFDADGSLTNDSTREFLRKFMTAFAAWIETNAKPSR
jgi:chromate reductase, NAD(P)H dehydrogenase (quinone)